MPGLRAGRRPVGPERITVYERWASDEDLQRFRCIGRSRCTGAGPSRRAVRGGAEVPHRLRRGTVSPMRCRSAPPPGVGQPAEPPRRSAHGWESRTVPAASWAVTTRRGPFITTGPPERPNSLSPGRGPGIGHHRVHCTVVVGTDADTDRPRRGDTADEDLTADVGPSCPTGGRSKEKWTASGAPSSVTRRKQLDQPEGPAGSGSTPMPQRRSPSTALTTAPPRRGCTDRRWGCRRSTVRAP